MIVDTFIFLNELDLLEIRLHTLYNHVDRFVLVESNQSFSTLTHKDIFVFEENQARFDRFLDKVIYIKLFNEYKTHNDYSLLQRCISKKNSIAWMNEAFTRDCILRGLGDCQPDDIIMISDVDEFPRPDGVQKAIGCLESASIVGFGQRMYRYFLNCRDYDGYWYGTKLTKYSTFRELGPEGVKATKIYYSLDDTGWHFSSIGSMEQLLHKMKSYSHFDRCYRGKYKNIEYLEKALRLNVIEKGVDIYKFHNSRYKFEEIDGSYPPYLLDHQNRYLSLIYQKPGAVGSGCH